MADELIALVGQWVRVNMADSNPWLGMSMPGSAFYGVLESVDDGAVTVKTSAEETVYLPRFLVHSVRALDPPPGEKEKLLRPTDDPAEETLVRPAGATSNDADVLPRVADRPQDVSP
jgi:hypothetical protein